MKKNAFIALMFSLCMVFCLILSACGNKPAGSASDAVEEKETENALTLESLVASDSALQEEIALYADAYDGLTIEVEGNDFIYNYDMTLLTTGIDEETLKSEAMKSALESAMAEQKTTFGSLCKTLEDQNGLTGIRIIVNYTLGDDLLVSGTFSSADAE